MITVEAILATRPCAVYTPERIRELVGGGLDPADPATLGVLLSLPPADARWVSRLLSPADAVRWAQACADRALGYSDVGATHYVNGYVSAAPYAAAALGYAAAAAARCADESAAAATRCAESAHYAAYASSCAAYASSCAAAAAAHDAAESAAHDAAESAAAASTAQYDEHRLACQHALALLASS